MGDIPHLVRGLIRYQLKRAHLAFSPGLFTLACNPDPAGITHFTTRALCTHTHREITGLSERNAETGKSVRASFSISGLDDLILFSITVAHDFDMHRR